MPIETINGINYHYQIDGAGPPMVLLHGFTGSAQNWDEHIPDLSQHYEVMRVDLLGHGQTSAPNDELRYTMPLAAADLAILLGRVCQEPVHLLGYSMGGRLALYLALTYPEVVRTLTLESASPGLVDVTEQVDRIRKDSALANRIVAEGIESFVGFWESIPLFDSQQALTPKAQEQLRQQRLSNRAEGLSNSLLGMGTGRQPSLWSRLGELVMPVHLIVGALDEKFVAINEKMVDAIPHGQLTQIEGAGHTVHLEKPESFRRFLLASLNDHSQLSPEALAGERLAGELETESEGPL